MYLNSIVKFLCLALSVSINAFSEDWPQWRGPNHNATVTGFVAPSVWPETLTKVWTVEVGKGDASPALVDGKLYTFSRIENKEIVRCLNAVDGKEIWQNTYDSIKVTGVASSHSGPRSSPAVADGKVVTFGVGGVLTCFEASSGRILWRKQDFTKDLPRHKPATSPLILDGMCIVQVGALKTGMIAAFDLDDGTERWRVDNEPPGYASPAVMVIDGEKHIVALTHENLLGISPADGKILWQSRFVSNITSTNSITPMVFGQNVFIAAKHRGTRVIRISKLDDGYRAQKLWDKTKVRMAFNTPVTNNGLIFALGQTKKLFCLNSETGDLVWKDATRRDHFGTIVNAESVIFLLPSTGVLTAFEPNGEGYKELANYHVSDSPTFSYPVISGNKIYIQDQDAITLWSIK